MARLAMVDPETATGQARQLLNQVHAKLGRTPNMMRAMAASPAVLEAYLAFSGALAGGQLTAKLREQIALTVAEANACQYCLSAHTAIGKMVGLGESDIESARQSAASDPKTEAALKLARAVALQRGRVGDDDVARARQAGYTDAEIAEIVAAVALNAFTNYFNLVGETEIDFPKVRLAADGGR